MSDEFRIVENEGRIQSHVVVEQSELIRAVIQFLQEIGLVHSMRALEQESGLTAEPLSVEMYCLRDMAVRGQWHPIFKFLSPLEGVKGVSIAEIKMKVCKQEFLEQLRGTPVDSKNTFELVEYYKRLVLMLQQLSVQGISEEEHRKLSLLLTLPETALQQEFKNWSIPSARLQLADEIMQAISKVIGYKGEDIDSESSSLGSQPECDMKKEIKGRLIQLTAKGLFYEKCEKSLLNNTKISTNKMIDISSMLPRLQEDTQPLKLLDIVCEEETNNIHNTKGVVLSPIMSLSTIKGEGKLDNVSVSGKDCDVEDNQIFSDLLREPKERPNGFTDEEITLKIKQEIGKDWNANTDVIAQSVITQNLEDENKPRLNSRISQSRSSIPDSVTEQNAGKSTPEEVKLQILSTPQTDSNTKRNIPTPGCDSSTPKPDKARIVLTPMPDESPIQPILKSDNKQAIRNQHKHSQSLNTSRQQRPIVRKLDLEGTNECVKTRHHSAKIADVSSIPKAVQWMVGLGRDREANKDKKILSENKPEAGTVEVEMQREMKNMIEIFQNLDSNETEEKISTPLVEKKCYKLIVSEESETKIRAKSPKFEPPHVQMIGELKDTQVVRSVSFHPTQKILAVGANSKCLYLCQYNGHVKNTEIDTEKLLLPFKTFTNYHKGSLYCVEWSPLGSLLASASNDQSIRVLSMSTDTALQDISQWGDPPEIRVHSGTVRALAFLNEKLLASGGAGDSQVRLVDVNKPTAVVTSLSHVGQINEVYSCSENELVTASQDEHVRIWDIRSSECVWKVRCLSPPSSVCIDKKELRIAASCEDGSLQIYDRRNTICFYSNKIHRKDVRSVRFKPATNDTLLTGSYDGEIKLTYPDLGISHQIAKFPQKIIQCRFSPEAEYMVSSSTDKTVKLWEFSNCVDKLNQICN
ncbi:hypothetical protein LOD99_6522 [Oopsacas minuta]|uniref:WD repeat-containing protein 47 n=1 Tax=Oopsacas minuta TaxID=111878 RepID=A0AAV7JLY4_9METZ|nr:hypothetical protein LOD99_6522 [Oopsacas minuta]